MSDADVGARPPSFAHILTAPAHVLGPSLQPFNASRWRLSNRDGRALPVSLGPRFHGLPCANGHPLVTLRLDPLGGCISPVRDRVTALQAERDRLIKKLRRRQPSATPASDVLRL